MPKTSEEYKYYTALCGKYEAFAHMQIGMNLSVTGEGKKVAIGHFKKANAIYNLVGMIHEAKQMDTHISMQITNMQAANNGGISFIVTPFCLGGCEKYL
jgi:hypothetical protein